MADRAPSVAVIGAARGMGRATALRLVGLGRRVGAIDLDSPCSDLGYQLGNIAEAELPEEVERIGADLRDPAQAERAALLAERALGGVDQLVVAAGGIVGGRPLAETPAQELHLALEFNLVVLHNAVRAFLPLLRRSPEPASRRIVAVVSVAGGKGLWGLGAYAAAKHGMVGYLRTLAIELAEERIGVNWVSPGSTRTAMLDRSAALYGLASAEEFKEHQPFGRLIEPGEIAAAIEFLLSAGAAGMTGVDLRVDAGLGL
ncbi:MAG: SDR family oxidoreductase [Actinomycetota bacterium]|nr:SDR family oxidoreductase [Actinomycetota bacterium]